MSRLRLPRFWPSLPIGSTRLVFGPIWIAVMPLSLWGARVAYVPLLGAALSGRDAWLATAALVALSVLALLMHGLTHVAVARALRHPLPPEIPIYPLGDAAQVWPAGGSVATALAAAIAGPAASLALALAAFAVWNAQTGTFGNTVALFLTLFNAVLVAVNLAPCYPFDGGRLFRALIVWIFRRPALGTRLASGFGLLLLACVFGWGAFLWAQGRRFSAETSFATFVLLVLIALALLIPAAWQPESPDVPAPRPRLLSLGGVVLLALIGTAMAGAFALILPLNSGLEAPGSAVSVGPMVQVPPAYARTHSGALLFTTVIPQAPIVVAEWLYAHADRTVRLTPAQEIVPPGTSLQQEAAQGVQDLQTSEQTAIVVGLRLAGYQASLTPEGAVVEAIVPGSGAQGALSVGDTIKAVNSNPVNDPSDISRILAAAPSAATAQVEVDRGNQTLTKEIRLSPPPRGSTAPRIGIEVAPVTSHLSLPFPVSINAREIVGGPSAGLIFTLAVYNAVTPQDVTAGRRIAGTGTIDLNGNVGPIGGVRQKVAAAEQAGAEYFLCPPDNCGDAQAVARHVQVVPVATVQQALAFLRTLTPAGQPQACAFRNGC